MERDKQCVLRVIAKLGGQFGKTTTVKVLKGNQLKEEVQEITRCERGCLKNYRKEAIEQMIDQFITEGLVGYRQRGNLQLLRLTSLGWEGILVPLEECSQMLDASTHDRWFEQLRQWRQAQAKLNGVSPFIICSNATLEALVSQRPQTLEALTLVSGMSEKKVADFGESLLACVKRLDTHV
ncbi:HRDC domain-containing protein [Vagococcus xieshaowenii]|uniref:DNA 3'-5' helicase n=1 Tax=Vagococcus xieshaowenii TaxID=2562451 RepID=A0AAJ5JLD9_9ENTE|nr:HRDC domain-containing protein [Vagococcus xieshaowenii]QCA29461.1 hypothetical protein E4Z98_09075 [Vagococcus xieshaowenii]TFZ39612.1 hypothetical protein E4031_08665 [Vagococcus xieshaowenii]